MSAVAAATGGRDGIVKTTITITVLHRVDNTLGDDIEEVLYEIREGDAIGWETDRTVEPVPADREALAYALLTSMAA